MKNRFNLLGNVSCDVRVTDIVLLWTPDGHARYGEPEYHSVPAQYQTTAEGELYSLEHLQRHCSVIKDSIKIPRGRSKLHTLLEARTVAAHPVPVPEIAAQIVLQLDWFSKKNPLDSKQYRTELAAKFYSQLHQPY